MRRRSVSSAMLGAAMLLLFAACGDDSSNLLCGPALSEEAMSDFTLLDVNPNSATYAKAVSPRDYLGRISAWYFGHAT